MCFASSSECDSTYGTSDLSHKGSFSSGDDDERNSSSCGGSSPSRRTTPHDDRCITAALEIKSNFSADLIQQAQSIRSNLGITALANDDPCGVRPVFPVIRSWWLLNIPT